MKWSVFVLLISAAAPLALQAADAEGCADLKPFPRLDGCNIVECAAKHHDSFDIGNGVAPFEADTNSLSYSCPLQGPKQQPRDINKMTQDFDAQLRQAGYLTKVDRPTDGPPTILGGKGALFVRWTAMSEDSTISYSLTTANTAPDKLEACTAPAKLTALKQCKIAECSSKVEDSIALRTTLRKVTSFTGKIQSLALSCPAPTFEALERELSISGFEIVFTDDQSMFSARSGERWVQFAPAQDGESNAYTLSLAWPEEVTPDNQEPPPVDVPPASPPQPPAAPSAAPPPPQAAQPPALSQNLIAADIPASPPAPGPATKSYQPVFNYPKPVVQVPIEPTADRVANVRGTVVIHLLVDVDEEGRVTKAVLTGRVNPNVRRLQSAALDAVSQWKFEPARQDGRVVACVKIPLDLRFQGRAGFSLASAFK